MSEGRLVVEKSGAVGRIVIDNPRKRNAISGEMWRAIPPAIAAFEDDPEVRCVLVRGAGTQAFAAGADISEFEKRRTGHAAVVAYDRQLDRALLALQAARKPSIAMIHGFCIAYSVEGHRRLVETVGHARAREVMYLARRYGAADALRMGLVHAVFPDAELEDEVEHVLKTLRDNAPLSIASSKTIIEEFVKSEGVPDGAAMAAAVERCAKSTDYEEGRRAFMEKRKPRFTGR
jgi:enoyl-CoA hydratase